MKVFHGVLGLLLIAGIVLMPVSARADYSMQDAIDIFLTAVGSQSLDPGLSTALGAAPGAFTRGLSAKCHQNMQRITDELMNKPSNYKHLEAELKRYQDVDSAINGDPGPLRKSINERNKKITAQKKKKQADEKKEHKDSMKYMLDQHQKEINELKELKKQILQNGRASLKKIKSNIREAGFIQFDLRKYETLILALVDQGKSYCDEARTLHQKIIALSAAMEDGEALVNTKVNLAKERRTNCKTDGDGIFIKNNYQAAQDAFAIMKTAKDAAFETLVEINIILEQNKRNNSELSQHDSGWWKEQRGKHGEFLKAIPQYLDQLKTGLKDTKKFPVKVQDLKNKIEESKQYYIQYFPGSKGKFDPLINEVSSIRLYYVTSIADLDNLFQEYQTAQTALETTMGNNSRLFRGAPPLINCFSNKPWEKVMDKIDESFLRGLLVLKTSDYLRNGCQVTVAAQNPSKDSDVSPPAPPPQTPFVDTKESTPGTPGAAPAVKSGQGTSSNSMGGLIISGPTEIAIDQGVNFTACDGTGVPYTSGSFSWNFSDESILSLGKSGNPVSGVGFKAGTVTIFVHYDGGDVYTGTAYLNVKIKDMENKLFGTSGGETTAGETTEPVTDINCDHIPGSTAVQGECICTDGLILSPSQGRCISCDEYYQASKNAITDGALDAAQAIVNEARECTSWTARVQGLINSARQDQVCKKIAGNLQAACQANNAKAAHGFMGEANQNNCNIDAGLWQWGNALISEYNQQIKDQHAAQNRQQQQQTQRPQQPQNQANWMDVMNTIIKGVQGVQQGQSKPSGGSSKPSSSLGSPPSGFDNLGNRTWNTSGGAVTGGSNTGGRSGSGSKEAKRCQGHTLYCKSRPNLLWQVVKSRNMTLDRNRNGICDICNLPVPKNSARTRYNQDCRISPWKPKQD